jgi:hypothetical protein
MRLTSGSCNLVLGSETVSGVRSGGANVMPVASLSVVC